MPDNSIEEIKRDLHADLKLLTAIPRDPDEESDLVHDVVAPHALRRAIAAEVLVEQLQAEIERLNTAINNSNQVSNKLAVMKEEESRQSREENEKLRQKLKDYEGCKGIEEFYAVRCKLRDCQAENERLRGELKGIVNPAWAVTVDNINLRKELKQLMAERDDYRKVLGWYAAEDGEHTVFGQRARSILSRYEKGESQ